MRLICRHWRNPAWKAVSNPKFDVEGTSENLAAQILREEFVDYVEYQNSGVLYRVIRDSDLQNYCDEDDH